MAVTNYLSINGQIHGEYDSGGNEVVYQADALGSVVTTLDGSGALANTYRFKPYGALLAKTGPDPDPKYLWTGTTPSRVTGRSYSDQYNRARHYGSKQAQWTSIDLYWPKESAFGYALAQPTSSCDPHGLKAKSCTDELNDVLRRIGGSLSDAEKDKLRTCIIKCGVKMNPKCVMECLKAAGANKIMEALVAFSCCVSHSFDGNRSPCDPKCLTPQRCCRMKYCQCFFEGGGPKGLPKSLNERAEDCLQKVNANPECFDWQPNYGDEEGCADADAC